MGFCPDERRNLERNLLKRMSSNETFMLEGLEASLICFTRLPMISKKYIQLCRGREEEPKLG